MVSKPVGDTDTGGFHRFLGKKSVQRVLVHPVFCEIELVGALHHLRHTLEHTRVIRQHFELDLGIR